MEIYKIVALFSSFSFLGYVISFFTYPNMKKEFERFGLSKLSLLVIVLQLIGAIGLIIGLQINVLMMISSFGLGLLMLLGLLVRIKLKDSVKLSFPAFFYMVLNFYVFYNTIGF